MPDANVTLKGWLMLFACDSADCTHSRPESAKPCMQSTHPL